MLYAKGVRKVIAESVGCKVYETTHVDGYIVEHLWTKYPEANLGRVYQQISTSLELTKILKIFTNSVPTVLSLYSFLNPL